MTNKELGPRTDVALIPDLSLADYVRLRRIELGMTQTELAEKFDPPLQQSDISAIERNRIKLPQAVRVRQLAAALQVQPFELLERSGWTGAAGKEAMASLEDPGELTSNSRWRQELDELLPRLSGSQIRVLLSVAKSMLPGGGG